MEDKELKKKLAKIPDVDKDGEPIYKIDDLNPDETVAEKTSTPPLFLENNSDVPKGNAQDIKTSVEE